MDQPSAADLLRARLATPPAPAWRPDQGDPNPLVGTVESIGERVHETWGSYPTVTVVAEDGRRCWHAWSTVARQQLADADPQPGDLVAVAFEGERVSASTGAGLQSLESRARAIARAPLRPRRAPGGPLRAVLGRPGMTRCAVCRADIGPAEAVAYVLQPAGDGPYPGHCGWYVAEVHEACAGPLLEELERRSCRGCHRALWVRGGRRTHCSDRCRHDDFKRRQAVMAEALARGVVIYRDESYWLTRPSENGTGCRIDGKP